MKWYQQEPLFQFSDKTTRRWDMKNEDMHYRWESGGLWVLNKPGSSAQLKYSYIHYTDGEGEWLFLGWMHRKNVLPYLMEKSL